MVGVEIGTGRGMQARRAETLGAKRAVASAHRVHIGRRAAEVGDISFEIGHPRDLTDLPQNRLLGARSDEFALMG